MTILLTGMRVKKEKMYRLTPSINTVFYLVIILILMLPLSWSPNVHRSLAELPILQAFVSGMSTESQSGAQMPSPARLSVWMVGISWDQTQSDCPERGTYNKYYKIMFICIWDTALHKHAQNFTMFLKSKIAYFSNIMLRQVLSGKEHILACHKKKSF